MGEYDLHSLILACDFRVDDVDRMWKWLKRQRDGLAEIGAHHVVLYTSIWEPRRVLVTIGIRQAGPVRGVLRSPEIFEWFSISGADAIPPIFGGEVVEKIDLYAPSPDDHVGRVIVGVMSAVDDVPSLMDKVHDGREVLILQEVADEVSARQWIDHPDAAAEWMSTAGFGAYPTQFVGKFAHLMTVDGQG
jgi:hypothetical protein